MSLLAFTRSIRTFLTTFGIQHETTRFGHQMCTHWVKHKVLPKRRGIKRNDGTKVEQGQYLVTQRFLTFHPGSHVEMKSDRTLVAMVPGVVRITSEVFDPNFDNPHVIEIYNNRQGQKIYKKYVNVIPEPQHCRFKLIDVV